jgi:hypothetical protein
MGLNYTTIPLRQWHRGHRGRVSLNSPLPPCAQVLQTNNDLEIEIDFLELCQSTGIGSTTSWPGFTFRQTVERNRLPQPVPMDKFATWWTALSAAINAADSKDAQRMAFAPLLKLQPCGVAPAFCKFAVHSW